MERPKKIDFEYGKNVYEKGEFTGGFYNYYEAFGLCQYLVWFKGFGFQRCKTYVKNFIEKADPSFNMNKYFGMINKMIKKAQNKQPDSFETVSVTESELINIEKIKDFDLQKILFSLLVYSKREKFDKTNVKKKKDFIGYHLHKKQIHKILVEMGFRSSNRKIDGFLNYFYSIGYTKDSGTYGHFSILYSDDNSLPKIEIKGNEMPFEKYIEFHNGEKIYCKNCEKMTEKRYGNQKYCKNCATEKEKTRKRNLRENDVKINS